MIEKSQELAEVDLGDTSGSINTISDRIVTLDDALEFAKVDRGIWEVERYTINSWEGMRAKRDGDGFERITLWQVKASLRRKITKVLSDAIDYVLDRAPKYKSRWPKTPRLTPSDPHELELGLVDAHFGKRAWGPETRSQYDTPIAAAIYHDVALQLLAKSRGFNVEKITFIVGSDFFQANNDQATTGHGTRVDHDGRFAYVLDAGFKSCIEVINECLKIAPVEGLWIPGNHDPLTSHVLARLLELHYAGNENVTIDWTPTRRKYRLYGPALKGFAHGDGIKVQKFLGLMVYEARNLISQATQLHWRLGHRHRKQEYVFQATEEEHTCTVTFLNSISGTDSWHDEHGFVGCGQAAESTLWSKEYGFAGNFRAYAPRQPF